MTGMNVIENFCMDESLFFGGFETRGVDELVSNIAFHGANDVHIAIRSC